MRVTIIAEAGVNHNGSLDQALAMVDAAARAGADAIKFQTFDPDQLVSAAAPKAAYQERATGAGNQHDMLRKLALSRDAFSVLADHCRAVGIQFLSTPFDLDSAQFLIELGMAAIKVPSGEIDNVPFLRGLAALDRPLIVSTGMATLDEVTAAVETVRAAWSATGANCGVESDLTLLHCTSNYPAQPDDVNLRAMRTMAEATRLAVGYSDHTLGIAVATAAVAMGATVIEKHFTLDRDAEGPDHAASLTVAELTAMVDAIGTVERAMGDGIKRPRDSELPVRDVARRSLFTARLVAAGSALTADDLVALRPAKGGIAPAEWDRIAGSRAVAAIPAGTQLTPAMIAFDD